MLLNDDGVISEGKSELSSLKPGDAVRVKFGSQWYNAEVCKHWDPKESKRGKYDIQKLLLKNFNSLRFSFTLIGRKPTSNSSAVPANNQQIPVEETPIETAPNAPPVADPYAEFVTERKKREAVWNANRAAKQAKPTETSAPQNENGVAAPTPRSTENVATLTATVSLTTEIDEVNRLKSQLKEKNKACEILVKKVEQLQETNQVAVQRHLLVSQSFCKVGTVLVLARQQARMAERQTQAAKPRVSALSWLCLGFCSCTECRPGTYWVCEIGQCARVIST